MPSRQDHLAKAERNQQLALTLRSGPNVDWSVTVLSYAALHLVEATLAPQTHSSNHVDRFANVSLDQRLRPMHDHYRRLYRLSLRSRYDCQAFSTRFAQDLYVAHYELIKQHLRPLLGCTF